VLSLVSASARMGAWDEHSQRVTASALCALVPPWVAASGARGTRDLWASALAALPGLPAPRRAPLLRALLRAFAPHEEAALPVALLLLLNAAADAAAKEEEEAAAAAPKPRDGGAAAAARAGAGAAPSEWLMELAEQLALQVGGHTGLWQVDHICCLAQCCPTASARMRACIAAGDDTHCTSV
jgi:hypothetical protein